MSRRAGGAVGVDGHRVVTSITPPIVRRWTMIGRDDDPVVRPLTGRARRLRGRSTSADAHALERRRGDGCPRRRPRSWPGTGGGDAARVGVRPERARAAVRDGAAELVLEAATEPFVILLIVAGVLAVALGEVRDGLLVLVALIPIVGADVVTEYRGERALEALREATAPTARVRRDGGRSSEWPRPGSCRATSCCSGPATSCRPTCACSGPIGCSSTAAS